MDRLFYLVGIVELGRDQFLIFRFKFHRISRSSPICGLISLSVNGNFTRNEMKTTNSASQ